MTRASEKTMKKRPTTAPRTAKRPTSAASTLSLAMHSAASPDWGTPMLLRRFAQVVLRPAALSAGSIDLDYATSAYWQSWWPGGDHPDAFLDGRRGRDVLVEADRRAAAPRLGSGFLNAPGLGGGDMVQDCWTLFERDHREEKLGSGCWIGFSVEQFGSLQNVAERNPLTCGADDLVTTIVPSRRAHYVVHPEVLIAITKKKQKRREKKSKQWTSEQKLVQRLRARADDAPVDAGAPSHLSYITLLWHRDRAVRRTQMEAARAFLAEQQADKKALLHKFAVIGPLELEAR
jgi:hypothetical protein